MNRKKFIDMLINILSFSALSTLVIGVNKLFSGFSRKKRTVEVHLEEHCEKIVKGKEFVLISKGDGAKVLSLRCPHLGCQLDMSDTHGQFICPCHGSRFDLEGHYLSGPAKKDMHQLSYQTAENGKLQIYLDS